MDRAHLQHWYEFFKLNVLNCQTRLKFNGLRCHLSLRLLEKTAALTYLTQVLIKKVNNLVSVLYDTFQAQRQFQVCYTYKLKRGKQHF